MMEEWPGFGFRPTDYELVGYYLLHKIRGNHNRVDRFIKEIVNICSFDPWDLRFQSEIKSSDVIWYFLTPRENNGSKQNRKTRSGYWKLTGLPVDVKDQWGHLSGVRGKKIGHKRVLTFHSGNQESSSNSSENNKSAAWVMHELHYTHTDLPEHKRMSYVMCRLEYKGGDENILSTDPTFAPTMANSENSVVVDQGNSEYYNTFPDYQDDQQYALPNQSDWNQEQQYRDWHTQQKLVYVERELFRDDPSRHRPKKSHTGTLPHDSMSDSDTDSLNGRDAWSSTESVGSTDVPYHTPKDDTPSLSEPLYNREAQEQPKQLELQLELQGKEKEINKQESECELKMAEDLIKKAPSPTPVKQSWIVMEEMSHSNPQWIYLKIMIIRFLLLWKR